MFSLEQLLELLSSLPDPAFVITRSGQYVAIYGGADQRFYHDGSSLIGKNLKEVMVKEKADWFLNEIEKAIDNDNLSIIEYGLSGSDVKGVDDDGPSGTIWFEGRVKRLNFTVNGEDAVLWVASNISNRHELEEKLRSQSETDALTGLWNRRYFERRANHERERAIRYNNPISILMFDIDYFKLINDNKGHEVGDAVLKGLSSRLAGSIRDSDILARWGGEEFLLLMPEIGLDNAAKVAENLRKIVEDHIFDHGVRVTISIGVAEWWAKEESLNNVVSRTDEALYLAKNAGRNRVMLATKSSFPDFHAIHERFPFYLEWRKEYESGDHRIDNQHISLFNSAQEILKNTPSLYSPCPKKPDISRAFQQIEKAMKDLREHFEDEEKILREIDWTYKEKHRLKHSKLFSNCTKLFLRLEKEQSMDSLVEFITYLTEDVIYNHLVKDDREFFSSLNHTS